MPDQIDHIEVGPGTHPPLIKFANTKIYVVVRNTDNNQISAAYVIVYSFDALIDLSIKLENKETADFQLIEHSADQTYAVVTDRTIGSEKATSVPFKQATYIPFQGINFVGAKKPSSLRS